MDQVPTRQDHLHTILIEVLLHSKQTLLTHLFFLIDHLIADNGACVSDCRPGYVPEGRTCVSCNDTCPKSKNCLAMNFTICCSLLVHFHHYSVVHLTNIYCYLMTLSGL